MSINFIDLKDKSLEWSATEEEQLINKLKDYIEKYEKSSEIMHNSFIESSKSLERLEIGCINSINSLKTISIKKFVEHVTNSFLISLDY